MKRLAVTIGVAAVGLLGAAAAQADPAGPGIGVCSFQGEYFTQYYYCDQPPSWLLQPHSDDVRPGAGTSTSPFSQ